jgi:peptide/nickel transport system substrate-binding protein
VEIVSQPFADYLASGPGGPVFGRKFDLAQFAWPAAGESLCRLYLSSQIPGPYPEFAQGWGGGNASGYNSPEFDQACQALLNSLPESESKHQALQQAQQLLLQDVPVIPLYWRFRLLLTRPDVCGLALDAQMLNPLWNLEEVDRGEACVEK